MFVTGMKMGRYLLLIALIASLTIVFQGAALAVEGDPQGGHAGSREAVQGHAEAGGHGGDRSGDYLDLLARFINFSLMVIILFLVIRKSNALSFFSRRVDEIKEKMDTLMREKEESETRYRELEKRLKDFEVEKEEIIKQARNDGLAEKEKIVLEAKVKAGLIIEQAESSIQQGIQSASSRLKKEVMNIAAQKAREIIAREMTEKDQDRLVDEFIERVGKIH